MYYRETSAVVVVFDLTSLESFDSAMLWVKEFRITGPANAVVVLVGNKLDLESERTVEIEKAQMYAQEIGAAYIETSAVGNRNIETIFETIAKSISEQTITREIVPQTTKGKNIRPVTTSTIQLSENSSSKTNRKCC
eukprot:TRINITY_DN2326_c0_g1_i2.p1 TRINITY_DN2326_c0_g1~~TRINITY_DN2326_c0_g1_i2.p1  ORF type:complete len:137 (-),score=23.88 TRINITY_DN2326_c0_g1_i2:627-1037(-)